ncbi:hypothetical protein [Natronorubrum sp. DTA28]|uniref:hypothetical protein n=1 Tax=Natronorubrum sp. DTA28 TaxID=3447019 RepID=UPI003F8427EA
MSNTRRAGVGGIIVDLGRAIGTFFGLAWLCFVVGIVLARATGTSMAAVPVPVELVTFGVLAVAFVGTSWLVDGGYERLGADPSGGATFAWLAVLFVPLAFFPTRLALGFLAGEPGVLDALFVLTATLFAGWLAFYGGLERLALVPDDFLRVAVFAVALGSIPVAAVLLADIGWLATDLAAATVAAGVQAGACWFGFRTDVL